MFCRNIRDYEKSVWKQKSTFFQSRLANADSKNKYDGWWWWCSETIRATAHSICHLFPFPHTFNPSKIPNRNFRRVISEWIGNFFILPIFKYRYFYHTFRDLVNITYKVVLLYSDISNFAFWSVNILKCKNFLIGILDEFGNLKQHFILHF